MEAERRSEPNRQSSWAQTVLVTIGVTAALLLATFLLGYPSFGEDSGDYRNLSLGKWAEVHQPFSARFLHPVLVQFLAHFTHRSVDSIFCIIGVVCVPLIVFGLALILRKLTLPVLLLIPALLIAGVVESIRLAYMPDIYYTLLLTAFFILIAADQMIPAAIAIVVLFCARESTLVLGATVAAVLWFTPRRRPLAVIFAVATVAGMMLNRHFTGLSAGNSHQVSGLTYMAGKVPYNFVKNVCGIQIWTNTLIHTQGDHPMYRHPMPAPFRIGGITEVGISEISVAFPIRWILSTAATFGLLLTVLLHSARQAWLATPARSSLKRARDAVVRLVDTQPTLVCIAGLYGVVSLILVPVLGTATNRYVYYAWPAMWILAAWLFVRDYLPRVRPIDLVILLPIHFLIAWLPILPVPGLSPIARGAAAVFAAIALQAIAWPTLTRLRVQARL